MKRLFLGFFLVFLFPCPARSSDFAAVLEKSSLEIALEPSYIKYKEPGIMRESGVMLGISGAYIYRDNAMLKAEARGSWGEVDYRNSGRINNIQDSIIELRALGGYDLPVKEKLTLTPYLGFGYRYLKEDGKNRISSTNAIFYDRISRYYYSPVGIEAKYALENNWSIGATAEYDIFWKGKQQSNLGYIGSGFEDAKNNQDRGYGVRSSIKVQRKLDEFNLLIEPFARYWNIKKSDVADQGFEPKNRSLELGCRIGMVF